MLGIILLIVGIIGLIKGKIGVTRTKELRRPASILVSLLFIAPFPLQILVGAGMGAQAVVDGEQDIELLKAKTSRIGLVIFLICFLAGLGLAFVLAKPKIQDAPKRKSADYDDFDDRPTRPRSTENDADRDDRPRRRDELDDRPR